MNYLFSPDPKWHFYTTPEQSGYALVYFYTQFSPNKMKEICLSYYDSELNQWMNLNNDQVIAWCEIKEI